MHAAALFLIASSLTVLTTSAALSAPLTGPELVNAYNLIVFGDVTSSSEVDGKSYVGGNATGGNWDGHNVAQGTGLPALTVGKNLSGNVNVNGPGVAIGGNLATSSYNGNGGGNAFIGGSWTGSANFNENGTGNVALGGTKTGSGNVNGGALLQNQNSPAFLSNIPTAATTSALQTTLSNYSASLNGLSQNSTFSINSGTATFNAAANAQVAVFNITNALQFFSAVNQITFNKNGAKEMIINVSGAGANLITLAANFLGGQAQLRGVDTLWNFTDATNIKITSQFGGDLLAALAAVTLNANEEGTLIAASLIQTAEVHYDGNNPNLPTPPDNAPPPGTPLPAASLLFGTGIGALGWLARRRKNRAAA